MSSVTERLKRLNDADLSKLSSRIERLRADIIKAQSDLSAVHQSNTHDMLTELEKSKLRRE